MKCSLVITNFLEEIFGLFHSIVSNYFFSLITEEVFLISPCYSLQLCIQMVIPFHFSFTFSASKVMLKILQARLQQYVNCELPDVQGGLRKGRGTRDQITNIHWIIKKARVPEKHRLLLY